GWPDVGDDFEKFYPTDVLVTASDIIYLWVARMIVSGLKFVGEVPFHTVYINTTIQDEEGRRMSRTHGTGIDPMEFIESIGADAVRFTMATIATQTQSIRFSADKFDIGKYFTNKIWNAARFLLMNVDENITGVNDFTPERVEDIWIMDGLNGLIEEVNRGYEEYRFNDLAGRLYDFFWHSYCDWYLELIKNRFYRPENEDERLSAQRCALYVMDGWLRLMHPIMPHITEEIYSRLPHTSGYIILAQWPEVKEIGDVISAREELEFITEVIRSIRNLRTEINVPPSKEVDVLIIPEGDKYREMTERNAEHITTLAKVADLDIKMSASKPKMAISSVVAGASVYLLFEGIVDADKELKRLTRTYKKLEEEKRKLTLKLENENFMTKAPKNVIDDVVRHLEEVDRKMLRIGEHINKLRGENN
ncbi:MAG: valine--tRNA ligase, partial [Candidatus Coatesbacteria bacterium]